MDSHQRRGLAREMRRLGLDTKPPVRSQRPDTAAEVRFIETPKFAIGFALFSLVACIVLTVLGVRLKHLSWLFIIAWIFSIPTAWIFSGRLKRRLVRVAVTILVLTATAIGLYFLNVYTGPPEEVVPSPLTLVWMTPNAVMVGDHLTAKQLNVKAISQGLEVPGTFVYNPTFGSTPEVGTDTLSVVFTPNDPTHFSPTTSTATVPLVVIDPHQASQSATAPIEISPRQVAFSQVAIKGGSGTIPSQLSQQYSFRITNTTDRDVYAIGAELRIKSNHLSLNDFSLGIPKSSWKTMDNGEANGMQTGDMMLIGCRSKQKNRSFFLVELPHLDPHESREIIIWETDPKDGSMDTAVVSGAIFHSTFEPTPTLRTRKGVMLMPRVPFPEAATIERLSVLTIVP